MTECCLKGCNTLIQNKESQKRFAHNYKDLLVQSGEFTSEQVDALPVQARMHNACHQRLVRGMESPPMYV